MVRLHLVRELMDIFRSPMLVKCYDDSSPETQIMMHLSVAAAVGSASPKTFSLSGDIQGHPLSILVDSSSSHTFLNSALAQSLSGIKELQSPVQVQVANGAILQCTSFLPGARWFVQGCSFSTDLKLLRLSSYDMILGLDWLARFSLMQVHWAKKWISIPYEAEVYCLLAYSELSQRTSFLSGARRLLSAFCSPLWNHFKATDKSFEEACPVHYYAFQTLKAALCQAPVLALPNFAKPFSIETDASKSGVGAVLMQDGHPLAFFSKALGAKKRGLSTYEKEFMAILFAVQLWRPYLQFQEFVLLTDQKSLTQLTDQRLHTHWQQRVFSKLLGLQYRIVYRSGSDNRAADALSRHPSPPVVCAAVTSLVPSWVSAMIASYREDTFATTLLTKLAVDSEAIPHYSLQSDLLHYNGRVKIGDDPALHQQLIAQFHSSLWGGHSGIPVTYMRLKQCFAQGYENCASRSLCNLRSDVSNPSMIDPNLQAYCSTCRFLIRHGKWISSRDFHCLIHSTVYW
ncbi:unnamed protein product [Miscanthus lutarioriparius]|uniref:Reverse transcriptase/retrotransposon-derived protein RNase H-like domain-containing protein n=1 Tax=Miscanthus lutarioriparius TaxID=422564 RepID=A0A811R6T1_9POAL|nr:unnamed protein product [Miscanthus lutarioriparius]